MDRFSRTCLLVCVLLLTIIAFRPIVTPQAALAANQKYKYMVAYVQSGSPAETQTELDTVAKDGWEFVAPVTYEKLGGGAILVFRKEL